MHHIAESTYKAFNLLTICSTYVLGKRQKIRVSTNLDSLSTYLLDIKPAATRFYTDQLDATLQT